MQLLALFKAVELAVGRVASKRYGPRAVDLDMLFCGSQVMDTRTAASDDLEGQLVLPHPKLAEREFVLRPLNE
jgi:dihydroneopterin aldolase / 2-amino-4-hydroxy-6-hydroxymethyldihydropteridine diphosphokinase / dihydropteroate synthase